MSNEKIKLFEMFAGYGGASFSLKKVRIDFECVGVSEIDKYAMQCYTQNHKGYHYGDCTKIDPKELPDFDLLTGGFPCQSFSVAGKGLGELDTRGTLFNEIIRIAEIKKPKYMLLENVKGLTNKNHRPTFDKILSELDRIGYKVYWKVLNSKEYGIPQNRERVFFVCFRNDLQKDFKFPEKEKLKIFLKDILEDEVDEKYYLKQEQVDKLLKREGFPVIQNKEVCGTLLSRDYKEPKCVQVDNSKIKVIGMLNDEKWKKRHESIRRVYSPEGIAPTIPTSQGGGITPKIIQKVGDRDKNNWSIKEDYANCIPANAMSDRGQLLVEPRILRGRPKMPYEKGKRTLEYKQYDICPTLSKNCGSGDQKNMVLRDFRIRKLTPKECFRLMGFLNDEIKLEGISNSQRYKLAGNGWDINLVSKIFKNMLVQDDKEY